MPVLITILYTFELVFRDLNWSRTTEESSRFISGKIKISTSDPVCAVQITAIDQILNTPVKANIIWEGFTSRFLLFDIPTNVHLADVAIELKNSNDLDIVEIRRFVKPNSRQEASPVLITILGKVIFRKDRIDRPGGGLLIAVPANISARQISFHKTHLSEYEILILQIVINDISFHLINLYASRGLNITLLNSFLETLSDPVFIFGDFNLHHPMWGSNHTSPYSEFFVEWLTNSHFILLNTDVPTHRSNVGSGALLDFTLCSSNLIGYRFESRPYGTEFSVDNHYTGWATNSFMLRVQSVKMGRKSLDLSEEERQERFE
ncbi:RNA-directed DNA polymerase from mobile element jockey [Trichonephila clavipes]|nr:RNA-directed DNA polymerase from mobile element jockey [Trichonephila clavipes]